MLHDKEDQEGIRLMEATMIRAKVDNSKMFCKEYRVSHLHNVLKHESR
jgi:hypothetical protein